MRGPLEPPRQPILNFQTKPSQKRKAQTGVRILDPMLFHSYPPAPHRNALDSQEPVTV